MFLLSTKKTGWFLSFQCAWVQYLTYPVVWALYGWQEKWDRCNLAAPGKAEGDLAGSAHERAVPYHQSRPNQP